MMLIKTEEAVSFQSSESHYLVQNHRKVLVLHRMQFVKGGRTKKNKKLNFVITNIWAVGSTFDSFIPQFFVMPDMIYPRTDSSTRTVFRLLIHYQPIYPKQLQEERRPTQKWGEGKGPITKNSNPERYHRGRFQTVTGSLYLNRKYSPLCNDK